MFPDSTQRESRGREGNHIIKALREIYTVVKSHFFLMVAKLQDGVSSKIRSAESYILSGFLASISCGSGHPFSMHSSMCLELIIPNAQKAIPAFPQRPIVTVFSTYIKKPRLTHTVEYRQDAD